MQPEKVQKRSEVIVECEMFDTVDLNLDIPWTLTQTDDDEESKTWSKGLSQWLSSEWFFHFLKG